MSEKPASVTARRWAELLRAEADASWLRAALNSLMQFRDPGFLSDAAERLRPKWEARMRADGDEALKLAERRIDEAQMFSEGEGEY